MAVALRSLASVKSYYFRQACEEYADRLARFELADFRDLWRKANAQALEWRRAITTPARR
jgi:hypothetical protein